MSSMGGTKLDCNSANFVVAEVAVDTSFYMAARPCLLACRGRGHGSFHKPGLEIQFCSDNITAPLVAFSRVQWCSPVEQTHQVWQRDELTIKSCSPIQVAVSLYADSWFDDCEPHPMLQLSLSLTSLFASQHCSSMMWLEIL